MSDWETADSVAKNPAGEYQALIGGQWVPATNAVRNDAGEFMVIRTPSQEAPQEAPPVSEGPVRVSGILGVHPRTELSRSPDDTLEGLGGRVTDKTGSPLLGTIARMAPDLATSFMGFGAGRLAAPAFEATGKNLMQSALKPLSSDLLSGKAGRAVDTLLERGLNVSKGGMEELRTAGEALNSQVEQILAQSGKTVPKGAVAGRIQDVVNRIEKMESTPQDSISAVERVYDQFKTNKLIPENIPVERANELKQGIYQMLKKKYGQLGSDTEEAQKALGRGYKEELEAAVPQITGLNAEASKIWNALNVGERRSLLELNKNPGGLAFLTHSPLVAAAYMADKSALFKSILARTFYSGKEAIPEAAGAAVGTAGAALRPNR